MSLSMIKRCLLFILPVSVIITLSGCRSAFKEDVDKVAAAMCKITGVMNKLRSADLADTATLSKLQAEEQRLEEEMARINEAFRQKYKTKLTDENFRKEYSREIRKAILDCPYLSKEDRARFEKEIN